MTTTKKGDYRVQYRLIYLALFVISTLFIGFIVANLNPNDPTQNSASLTEQILGTASSKNNILTGAQSFSVSDITNINTCQNLDTADTVYNVTQNISTTGNCFLLTAQNITLDCNNFFINGSGVGNGFSDFNILKNLTIRNCNFYDFLVGVNITLAAPPHDIQLINITSFNNFFDLIILQGAVDIIDSNFSNVYNFGSNIYYAKTGKGKITFSESFGGSTITNFSRDKVVFDANSIFVNTTVNSGALNQSANITLYSDHSNSVVKADFEDDGSFVDCPANVCTIQSFVGGNLTFNVSHFTTYKAVDVGGVVGNESNVTTSGIEALNITIDGFNDTLTNISGVHSMQFFNGSTLLVNFTHNFSESGIDLSEVTLIRTADGLLINLSGQLSEGENKTMSLIDNSYSSICVDDTEIGSLAQVSTSCSDVGEILFSSTECGTPTTKNGITCTLAGGVFTVEGLNNSAIQDAGDYVPHMINATTDKAVYVIGNTVTFTSYWNESPGFVKLVIVNKTNEKFEDCNFDVQTGCIAYSSSDSSSPTSATMTVPSRAVKWYAKVCNVNGCSSREKTLSLTMDMNLSNSNASFYGEGASDQAGRYLSNAGDVNGDGYDDILIGSHLNSEWGSSTGQAYIIFGSVNGWSMDVNLSNANASWYGEAASDTAGSTVSNAGDVNGDGYDDILIASTELISGAGKTYLILGKATGWSMDVNLSNANASFIGEVGGDSSGQYLSSAGDVNGDGYDDILIGATGYGGGSFIGKTYLILGKATGWSIGVGLGSVNASWYGEIANDFSGVVSGTGDVNNDGYDDILIGARGNDEGASPDSGQSYLILGKATGWSTNQNLSTANASFLGNQANDGSGIPVSNNGDVNNDGYDDILIGAPKATSDRGRSYTILGKATGWNMDQNIITANSSWYGEVVGDRVGTASGAGDINGDGYDDTLIGTTQNDEWGNNAGQSYLILGKATGWPVDQVLSNANASFYGEAADDLSGGDISNAGDINGDGYDDILIGAYQNSEWGSGTGQVYIILSSYNEPEQTAGIFSITANTPPTIDVVILNSTFGTNLTSENLTAYPINVSDIDGDSIKNITDWRMNGSSIAVVNMPFENHNLASTNATDYSSFGNDGTVSGATWSGTGGYDGKGAYEFDGTDYLSISDSSSLTFTEFTLAAWVKVTGASPSTTGGFFSQYKTAGGQDGYWSGVSGGVYYLTVGVGGGDWCSIVTSPVPDADWHYYTSTHNDTVTILYIDGQVVDSNTTSCALTHFSGNLEFGRDNRLASNYMIGTADEMRIYDQTLSPEQIQALYQNQTDLIVSNETSAGDIWQACVTPNDGTENGAQVCSNNLTISNIAPALDAVILNSTLGTNLTTENLTVYPINVSDLDGDNVTLTIRWSIDSVINTTFENLTTINSSFTSINDTWQACVTPNDGTEDGTQVCSNNLTILPVIYTCGSLSSNLTLTNDVSSLGTCFTITADDVTLDCDGFTITYDTAGTSSASVPNTGIKATNVNNITIRNCNIKDNNSGGEHGYGIYFVGVNESLIVNNSVLTNGTTQNHGVFTKENSINNTIENNTVQTTGSGSLNYGIYLYNGSLDSKINNNSVTTWGVSGNNGIQLDDFSHNSIVTDNRIDVGGTGGSHNGIFVDDSTGLTIRDNAISADGATGLDKGIWFFSDTNFSSISNNVINVFGGGNNEEGIELTTRASNNNITNNSITVNGTGQFHIGVRLANINKENSIVGNDITVIGLGTDNQGISLSGSIDKTTILDNHITTNGTSANIGITLQDGTNATIRNNSIETEGTDNSHGISMVQGSDNNIVEYNNITTTGTFSHGISIATTSSNNILENNLISASGNGLSINDSSGTLMIDSIGLFANYSFNAATLEIEQTGNGSIEFLSALTGSTQSLVGRISISNNSIFLNSTHIQFMNVSSQITLNNINFTDPKPQVDFEDDGTFVDCDTPQCVEESYDNVTGEYVFNVSSFTTYRTQETLYAPNVTQPNIQPDPAVTTDILNISTTYTDPEADNGNVTVNWTVDGVQVQSNTYPVSNGSPVTDNLSSTFFNKTQNVTVFVQAEDNNSYMSTVLTDSIIISNTPPGTPVIAISPSVPRSQDSLTCTVTTNSTDSDSDSVNYTYEWFNGSTPLKTTSNTGSVNDVLGSGNTTPGDIINCTVTPFDGQDNGTFTSETVTVNFKPSVTQPSILPDPANTTDTLNISTTYTDIEADNGNVTVNWTVDGVQVQSNTYAVSNGSLTIDNLSSTFFNKSQNVTVFVQAEDNNSDMSTVLTDSIIISNTLPTTPTINLSPSPAQVVENLTCTVTTNSTDSDGDSINYTYGWFNGSTLLRTVPNVALVSDVLGSGNTSVGDTINCTVTPFDGEDNGTAISQTSNILSETTPPTSSIDNLRNGQAIGSNGIPYTINGTSADNDVVAQVNVSINNSFFVATGTTAWSYAWTPVLDGDYTIFSQATDASGNNEIALENITVAAFTTSIVINSNASGSSVINSTINDSTIDNSVLLGSTAQNSFIDPSVVEDSNITNSAITDSTINLSTVINSTTTDCVINSSVLNGSTCTGSTTHNSTTINSTYLTGTVVLDALIINDECISGTIIYNGQTTTCPVSLSTVYTPTTTVPAAAAGGRGGGGGGGGTGSGCEPQWRCTEWGECSSEGVQTRTCRDTFNCSSKVPANAIFGPPKPEEQKVCTLPSVPEEPIIPIEEIVERLPLPEVVKEFPFLLLIMLIIVLLVLGASGVAFVKRHEIEKTLAKHHQVAVMRREEKQKEKQLKKRNEVRKAKLREEEAMKLIALAKRRKTREENKREEELKLHKRREKTKKVSDIKTQEKALQKKIKERKAEPEFQLSQLSTKEQQILDKIKEHELIKPLIKEIKSAEKYLRKEDRVGAIQQYRKIYTLYKEIGKPAQHLRKRILAISKQMRK